MSNLSEAQRAAGADGGPVAPEPPVVSILRKIDRGLAVGESVLLCICLAALILLAVFQSVKRHFFPPSPFWVSEVVRYAVFCVGLIGAALATQSDRLFNIDMMTRMFRPRGKMVIRIITSIFTIVVCYYFFIGSMYLRSAMLDETGEVIPPGIGILSLPIAAVLIATHMALHILIDVYYLVTGRVNPDVVSPVVSAH
jgi:TRAP-type C4-dicarboxylate transport system permease small subunit